MLATSYDEAAGRRGRATSGYGIRKTWVEGREWLLVECVGLRAPAGTSWKNGLARYGAAERVLEAGGGDEQPLRAS